MQTLQLQGEYSVRLEANTPAVARGMAEGAFGDDLPPTVERLWSLNYRGLANATQQSIYDPEIDETLPQARYAWRFFVRRLQDGEAFTICNPETGSNVNVKIAQDSLAMTLFAQSLFSMEVLVEEYA